MKMDEKQELLDCIAEHINRAEIQIAYIKGKREILDKITIMIQQSDDIGGIIQGFQDNNFLI